MAKDDSQIQTEPGAKRRFERVVDHMLNTPPKPRAKKGKAKRGKTAKKKARQ